VTVSATCWTAVAPQLLVKILICELLKNGPRRFVVGELVCDNRIPHHDRLEPRAGLASGIDIRGVKRDLPHLLEPHHVLEPQQHRLHGLEVRRHVVDLLESEPVGAAASPRAGTGTGTARETGSCTRGARGTGNVQSAERRGDREVASVPPSSWNVAMSSIGRAARSSSANVPAPRRSTARSVPRAPRVTRACFRRGAGPGPHAGEGGGANRFGFEQIDHVTSNFQTMKPIAVVARARDGVRADVGDRVSHLGCRSRTQDRLGAQVDRDVDPVSQTKFANNEPARRSYKSSQINIFTRSCGGDGVQHVALTVTDILSAVRGLRARVSFMPTPGSYYDLLPARIAQSGIGAIDENLDTLRELEILLDGDHHRAYMLQIFSRRPPDCTAIPTPVVSSTRSSSARAIAGSAPATSARCSSRSSASSS